jgi:hypothetical protein
MPGDFRRVSVNLLPKAAAVLDDAIQLSGYSQTDTINRALQAYAFLLKALARGGGVYVRETADGELFRVEFL